MDLEQWKSQRTWKDSVDYLKKMIPVICPQWTDFNVHDPGMTVVELIAWLQQIQMYHLRQIGREHRRAYLKLLGVRPVMRSPGYTFVTVKSAVPLRIPCGTRFYADHIPFESGMEQMVTEGAFLRFVTGGKTERCVLEGAWIAEGRGVSIYPFGREAVPGNWMEIHLSCPLQEDVLHTLYMEFSGDSGKPGRRVDETAYDGHGYYPLAEIRTEYLAEDGWRPVMGGPGCPGNDCTYAFIQNGSVGFRLDGPMKRGRYCLRFTLVRSDYLYAPCVTRLSLAMVRVWQQESLGEDMLPSFEGTGFPAQRFDMEEMELREELFALEVENPESRRMESWQQVEDFYCSGPQDLHYRLVNGVLIFGDGIHGLMPEGRILVKCLIRTMGDRGNIKSGTIDRMELSGMGTKPGRSVAEPMHVSAADCGSVSISHEMDVVGGTSPESEEETLNRFLTEQKGEPCSMPLKRAVTPEDYERLVMDAPGLDIECCRAYSVHPELKEMVLAVKPYSHREKSMLNQGYLINLYRYLEEKRLLGARIRIVSPDYYDVTVVCTVCARVQYRLAAQTVEDAVRSWIAGRGFGQGISYGELLGLIDGLPCVQQVQSMWLDGGSRGRQNSRGDILLPANGLLHLKKVTCNLMTPMRERL